MNNIDETIAEVLRLDAQATPGPWYDQSTPEGGDVEVLVDLDEEWAAGLPDEFAPRRWDDRPICALPAREGAMRPGLPHEQRAADAALIAYYRTAAPALAREVQRLQGEIQPRIDRSIAFQEAMEEAEAERDAALAEVQRLQGDVRRVQTGHDCALVAAYESGHRAGQEAMREKCIDALGSLPDYPACCPCSIDRRRSRLHYSPHCEGWQDAMDRAESAIRALEVEP